MKEDTKLKIAVYLGGFFIILYLALPIIYKYFVK